MPFDSLSDPAVEATRRRMHSVAGHDDIPRRNDSLVQQLDLTGEQQRAIGELIADAQRSGQSPSDLLAQIESLLTPTQQGTLTSLVAGSSAYTSSANATPVAAPSYLLDASA